MPYISIFFLIIILSLSLLVGILAFGGGNDVLASVDGVSFEGIKSNEDRIAFIKSFGIEVGTEPVEENTDGNVIAASTA